ncbi:MAG: hypothetical protein WCF23_03820 [Candidatus Nitrosopolaris sp.]
MIVARSMAIPTRVNFAIDIAFVSIYPNEPLTITFGAVAAIAVCAGFGMYILHIYTRVMK